MAINKVIVFIVCCGLQEIWSQKSIPESLRECYRSNDTFNPQLPLNLRILVDIIRKMEKHSYTTMDLRMMSSSLLHRFKFDGIEYQKGARVAKGVIPFSATGAQRVKQKLIDELIPGNAEGLPVHILSQVERCILHQAVSNTVHNIHSRNRTCNESTRTEKFTGKMVLTDMRNCPNQQGVILTPYGTVSPGSIIGSVAASLQHQTVAVNQLLTTLEISSSDINTESIPNSKYNEEEIDFVLPKSQMNHEPSMWHRTLMDSPTKIDNVWLTTIAGELAEMVVFQGPLVGRNMTLGATGFWNNTMRPTIYYLTESISNFDATRAELIGGVDGMIIGSNLETWVQDFYSIRLSQLLDMYYSYDGITFNSNIRACDRAQNFLHVAPRTILNEQTYAIAQLLAYHRSIAYISFDALQRMVDNAIEQFYTYAEHHLFPEVPCYDSINLPRVEALIAFDGAWSIEYTTDFLSVLIQDLDVSMYGSKMGIIHGTSGEWMLNVTNSPSLAFQTLNNFANISWPTRLNYVRVLETVSNYLNKSWETNRRHHRIGNLGQVVVLLTPLGYMSNNETQSILTILEKIKHYHPDVHFVYYTSRYNNKLFKSFILSDVDHLVRNSNIDAITQYLSRIPRTLRPAIYLDSSNAKNITSQFEDYISPSKTITYRFHSHWRRNFKKILFSLHTFGYGTMEVCSWIQFQTNQRERLQCTNLSDYQEIMISDHFKCIETSLCPHTYVRIQNVTSSYKCAEIECKTPDQVRFVIRSNNVYYTNSADTNAKIVLLISVLLFVRQWIL